MNDLVKNLLTWAIIAVVLISIFNHYASVNSAPDQLTYSQFLENVRNGTVEKVHVESSTNGNRVIGRTIDGTDFNTFGPPDPKLVDELVENKVEITAEPPAERSVIVDLFLNILPVLLLVGLWVYFMRQMQGGGGGRGAMSFGKSRAKLQGEDQVNVTFADVAGVEEAKEEVAELVEFLRNPGKFQ
ncbi:MAG: ATP-dependent metalloprotease, partial [Xanthomonadales bacterium]|nr:ATP-dependent metalloprotease [Xanthomonadales bacterium]